MFTLGVSAGSTVSVEASHRVKLTMLHPAEWAKRFAQIVLPDFQNLRLLILWYGVSCTALEGVGVGIDI